MLPSYIALGSALTQQGLGEYFKRSLGMTKPDRYPSSEAYDPLTDAAIARAAQLNPDASPLLVGRAEYVPNPGEKVDISRAASINKGTLPDGREASRININPNVDRSMYAHELGHAVSQKTNIGKFINEARHKINNNPKLSRAVMLGITGAVPAVAAGLQEGDDDVAGSIALAAAIASPTLVDEALASKNALAIMNDAGMRATAGQRGRLAGGYLSYLAPVLLAGGVGTAIGNAADDYTALYNLGGDQQTAGTLKP